MNILKVTPKNLEFITDNLFSKSDIALTKGTNNYILYDDDNRIKIEENKKKKTQRCEICPSCSTFSAAQLVPFLKRSKYLELPKEDNLEDIMASMNYKKIGEVDGFERYKNTAKFKFEIVETFKFLKNFNIKAQLKDYFSLWKDEPEFKSYEMLRIISMASQGALMGSVMPSFWDYGGAMKMAGTLAASQKIITPLSHMVTSGSMGKVVDKASVSSDIKGLKTLQKKVGGMYAFLAADTFLMQKDIINLCPSPEAALLILFGLQTIGMSAGKMSIEGKSFYAVRDYLIRKNPELINNKYKDKFYQITGTGQALGQLSYAAAFTSSWLACKSNPWLILPVAAVSAVSVVVSKFLWGYQRKLKNPVTIKAKDYIQKGNDYAFDSGWKISAGDDSFLENKMLGYQLPLREGITIKSEYGIQIKEGKSLEFRTEKSKIKINAKQGYKLDKINDREYVITPLLDDN